MTLFVVRRDEALEIDEIAIFPANGPMSETAIVSRNRDLGRGYYGSVTMPSEPGAYRVAVLREGDRVVQGVSEITVEPTGMRKLSPAARFWSIFMAAWLMTTQSPFSRRMAANLLAPRSSRR
jgi:hypothetical protein